MTKTIGYTVGYYLGSARQSGEDETFNFTVQVLAPDTMLVTSVPSKTFTGYNYAYTSETLPATVANGSLIEVHYSAAPAQTKTLTYTVDYYRDGVLADGESVVVSTTVDINAADTVTVTSVPEKTFDGYTLESTDPALPVTVVTGSVINVYYTSVGGTVTIADAPIPEAGGRAWSLVNLICTALAFIGALYLLIKKAAKKNDALSDEAQKAQDERSRKRKLIMGIAGVIIFAAAIVTFILTEDMRLPMTIIDKWTPLMVVFFLGQMVNVVLSARKKNEEKSETAQYKRY
jgi:hypothetical protein